MKIEHELSPAYRQHVAEVLAQIRGGQSQIVTLNGQIRLIEQEIATMRTHLGVVLNLAAKADGAPESTIPYQLSEDGARLIGEMAEKPEPPAPTPEPEKKEDANGMAE